jgi:hypothetical protein
MASAPKRGYCISLIAEMLLRSQSIEKSPLDKSRSSRGQRQRPSLLGLAVDDRMIKEEDPWTRRDVLFAELGSASRLAFIDS